jgi:TolB-like protein
MSIWAADRYATCGEWAGALAAAAHGAPVADRRGVVVLPFANHSPDADNEYFSDGLTEEIISDLASIKSLQVISRTSAMQLKGTSKDVRTIGRELGVRYVLEGSVRKAGNSLRITAQLIDAASDTHLWGDKYGGTLDDVFELQERVSREIVKALGVTLTNDEDRRLAHRSRVVDAFEARLKEKPAIEWLEALAAAGVPAGVVRTVREALSRVEGSPLTGVEPAATGSVRLPPPTLGEHSELVRQHGWKAFKHLV